MRRPLGFVGGMLAALALAMLMAPTGGFPSRPRFQSVTVGTAAAASTGDVSISGDYVVNGGAARVRFNETDAAADEKQWRMLASAGDFFLQTRTDVDGVGATPLNVTRTGTTVDSIELVATAVSMNGNDATADQGTYSATITGGTSCSPAASITVVYTRIGDLVVLQVPDFSCTSNATTFSLTGAPVSLRPSLATGAIPIYEVSNNSVLERGTAAVTMLTNGTLSFLRNGSPSGWTASGGKSLSPNQAMVVYTRNTN